MCIRDRSVISTFETCNTFFHLKSSDSAIGNQIRKRRRIVMNIENAIQEPKELSLPYISNFLRWSLDPLETTPSALDEILEVCEENFSFVLSNALCIRWEMLSTIWVCFLLKSDHLVTTLSLANVINSDIEERNFWRCLIETSIGPDCVSLFDRIPIPSYIE